MQTTFPLPYYELYRGYPLKLQRADVRRYFILYELGKLCILWTSSEADRFMQTTFPLPYYELYRGYPLKLQRADVRRYFILYEVRLCIL